MTGKIIIVTGTTGSGKTTTCKEFVSRADDLWLHFGVDIFLSVLTPKKFVDGGPRSLEGVHMAPDNPDFPEGSAHLELGKYGAGMLRSMHEMALAGVKSGQNIIMDHVTTVSPPLLQDCISVLSGVPVLFVALKPHQELLAERIDSRLPDLVQSLGPEHGRKANEGTKRVSGYLYREIFSHDCFDLVVDTGLLTPPDVVAAILERLDKGPGTAFRTLADRFGL